MEKNEVKFEAIENFTNFSVSDIMSLFCSVVSSWFVEESALEIRWERQREVEAVESVWSWHITNAAIIVMIQ